MFKRKRIEEKAEEINKKRIISVDFISECENDFNSNTSNIIARNAITSVGSQFATTNSNRVNELTYVFLNSVKKNNLKATNQGHSGRCWMFAALNTFRHVFIKILSLTNFEFSETYLFFWDKFERCNSYIQWFIDHPEENIDNRGFDYMINNYMCDGGYWHTFANLVNKYGLIPKDSMQETATSTNSDEMNSMLKNIIDSCVNHIVKNKKYDINKLYTIKDETMKEVYNTLVKFLGEPPKQFNWAYHADDDCQIINKINPQDFRDMVAPSIDMINDFVCLSHIPTKGFPYNQIYKINYTNNVYEGNCCTFFNTEINELAKYAMKSISSGFAVWFGADITKSFNWFHSALDDELDNHNLVFEEKYKFDKGDRMELNNLQGNHAMALTGFNIDEKEQIINWQVENSWGYWDNETPGMDGFLTMSHSWFKKNVTMIVVLKHFLSRTMRKKIETAIVKEICPWDNVAPAIRTGIVNPPISYLNLRKK